MLPVLKVICFARSAIIPQPRSEGQGYVIRTPKNFSIYPGHCISLFLNYNIEFPKNFIGKFSPIPNLVVNKGLNIIGTTLFNSFQKENQIILCQNLDIYPIHLKRNDTIALLTVEQVYTPNVKNIGLYSDLPLLRKTHKK